MVCAWRTWPAPSLAFFFFTETATTEIYTLSLHDALPICEQLAFRRRDDPGQCESTLSQVRGEQDRKSTRLNSSHVSISYAVFCLKKKKVVKELLKVRTHARIRRQSRNNATTETTACGHGT